MKIYKNIFSGGSLLPGHTVCLLNYTEGRKFMYIHKIEKLIYREKPTNLITVVKLIICLNTAQMRRAVYFTMNIFFFHPSSLF